MNLSAAEKIRQKLGDFARQAVGGRSGAVLSNRGGKLRMRVANIGFHLVVAGGFLAAGGPDLVGDVKARMMEPSPSVASGQIDAQSRYWAASAMKAFPDVHVVPLTYAGLHQHADDLLLSTQVADAFRDAAVEAGQSISKEDQGYIRAHFAETPSLGGQAALLGKSSGEKVCITLPVEADLSGVEELSATAMMKNPSLRTQAIPGKCAWRICEERAITF